MYLKFISSFAFVLTIVLSLNATGANAQIRINVPKIPKIDGSKTDSGNSNGNLTKQGEGTATSNGKSGKSSDLLYGPMRPNGTPQLIKTSIYVQAQSHNEYWKMKGQRNHSSWVPLVRFDQFYNNDSPLNYTVDYFNPDGSAWYSEKLESSGRNADRTVVYKSPSPWAGTLDTKSTDATGIFSFKITNDATKEVLYQGKFNVDKFSTSNGGPDKNKFGFYVDHDWLMPYGTVGFHHSVSEIGGMPPLVSVWIKGTPDASDLEGRIFYQGKQIGSTKDGGGASDYDERAADMSAAFAPLTRVKRWQFQWKNVLVDNNGTFNRDNFPNAFYIDKNPGNYTVKIYNKGVQIRELEFTVGSDGRFVKPAYSDQVFIPYYTVVLPVKVTSPEEKWNATAWKTESFYANPVSGFGLQ
jgi:hypothetical protein